MHQLWQCYAKSAGVGLARGHKEPFDVVASRVLGGGAIGSCTGILTHFATLKTDPEARLASIFGVDKLTVKEKKDRVLWCAWNRAAQALQADLCRNRSLLPP